MSSLVFLRLAATFAVVALGWAFGRTPLLRGREAARALSNAAFFIFAPALLFRTTARIDFAQLPWRAMAAFFVPVTAFMLVVYATQRPRMRRGELPQGGAGVRAITASFGNLAQLGIPVTAALFGETGLAIHLAIVSLHALTLLTVLTLCTEMDLAHSSVRTGMPRRPLLQTLATTVRNTVIHPIVLPVLLGMLWNLGGVALPQPLDEVLQMLSQAVVPLCLIAIGLTLAHHGVTGALASAAKIATVKLLLVPAIVLPVAHFGFRLDGLPLAVVVMCAAMPAGSNALLFAQRYGALEAETTTAIVLSTLGFAVAAPVWLLALHAFS
ncbi:MAG TPA: AEC family transporter [Burkholderiaceae bacterium]|nr:AEC family transporter [Burkholderiaceae bacterium]